MDRRNFLHLAAASAGGLALPGGLSASEPAPLCSFTAAAPTHSVIPVLGDGNWVWTEPPEQTGYLEPREFDLEVGVQMQSQGTATSIRATTVIPLAQPGQSIEQADIKTQGCTATFRQLGGEAAQLILGAGGIVGGQTIGAMAVMRVKVHKEYFGYSKEMFPAEQSFPIEFRKQYMFDSPGIQTRQAAVREMAKQVGGQYDHPWDKAKAFHEWVWKEITARRGPYTSVIAALRDRVGDCEEKAAVFCAFCRASGIPARLVWVPNHNWAEFYLRDAEGEGHWIPAHTSCYSWFGWTGVHEIVLQKGDSIALPEKRKPVRLLADWMQWQGKRPEVEFFARLKPVVPQGESDPGPGARDKDAKGEWVPVGPHAEAKFMRR